MASIENLDLTDPAKDPKIIAAAALTRFAWGEPGAAARQNFEALMEQRGFSKEAAAAVLRQLNSLRRPGDPESGGEAD